MSGTGRRLDGKLPISVIVPVRNEEINLPDCLDSVAWADEIVVVDSHSTDQTATVAQQRNARVVQFDFVPGGPRKKNWALDHLDLRNDWVLLIDADERVTPELAREIATLFQDGAKHRGYYLNRLQFFLGRWLYHGGNFPSWNLRLLRRDAGRYERLGTEDVGTAGDVEVHEHVLLDSEPGYLNAPLLHVDFKDLWHFIDRHNRYSTWDAHMREHWRKSPEQLAAIPARFFGSPVERKRYLKKLLLRLPGKPLIWFVYTYFFRLGFLDGRAGFIYACLKAVQEFHIGCKSYERHLIADGRQRPPAWNEVAEPASRTGYAADALRDWFARLGMLRTSRLTGR